MSQSKHAMLIMAHNQFEILKLLMRQLDDERNDLFIHVDKKAKMFSQSEFDNICTKSKVYFIPQMSIYWGHSSIVECELCLLEAALKSGEEYSYMHLLSGVDLQLKSNDVIHKFFDAHPDRQFLAVRNPYSGLSGMNYYYFFQWFRCYSRLLSSGFEKFSLLLQKKILHVNRLKNVTYSVAKAQQWFSITSEFAAYVVEQRSFIREFTRYTSCSDEMFLATVLVNSPFVSQWYHENGREGDHMRLIDRVRNEGASPHTWRIEDWELISNSPYFWARKFDLNVDKAIIEKVFNTIK